MIYLTQYTIIITLGPNLAIDEGRDGLSIHINYRGVGTMDLGADDEDGTIKFKININ